jgi:hypothetical protein
LAFLNNFQLKNRRFYLKSNVIIFYCIKGSIANCFGDNTQKIKNRSLQKMYLTRIKSRRKKDPILASFSAKYYLFISVNYLITFPLIPLLEDVGGELVNESGPVDAVEVVVVLTDDAGQAGGAGAHRKVEQVVHLGANIIIWSKISAKIEKN